MKLKIQTDIGFAAAWRS